LNGGTGSTQCRHILLASVASSVNRGGMRVNVVTLIGNLATDVELRDVGEDLQVATFLLAVNRPGKDEADFVRISTWNRQAELCAQYLAKGRKVGVDGRLRSSSWEDSDGNKRNAIEVVANRVEFLSPPPGKEEAADIPFEAPTPA
jgi:single-strand DNA-binding protein